MQLDNSGKENKNHTMFYIFGYMVSKLSWFLTVQINFLIVGHTHEDVDQWHSIAQKLYTYDRNTLDDMKAVYRAVSISFYNND